VKVLLTGGTGFLGKNVARQLSARGHALRILARETSDLRTLPSGVEVARGDVTLPESVREAAQGCDAVLHMAALVKSWAPDRARFEAVNVGGLRNALAAAEGAGARLVYTSSFMAIGPAGPEPADESQVHPGLRYCNDYERTKAVADRVARGAAAAGADVVMLYPGVVYGPGELTDGNLVVQMIADHLRGRLAGVIGPGDRLWSYSFVEDVALGHALALEKGRAGERYFLCGDNATQQDLFRVVQQAAKVAPPRLHIPYAVASTLGRLLWIWADVTGHPPMLTHGVVDVFKQHWAYTSKKAERELGYSITPLALGIRRTVDWLRAEGHV
jgi:NAD+-dependent farnesol dehydrogenase